MSETSKTPESSAMDDAVARILDADYLSGLTERSIDDVRAMRSECQDVETGLSYLRRVVQGHLDIIDAELARRREGGEPGDLSSLIDRLPEILGDHLRAPGNGRLTTTIETGRVDPELQSRLDALVAEADLGTPADLDEQRLVAAREALADLEQDVSNRRRRMFDCIDSLQAELTRRYRTGEATVESLLK